MRTVDFEYRGQVLHLCLNGAALFAIRDEYGSETPIFDLIAGDGSEAFQRMCRIQRFHVIQIQITGLNVVFLLIIHILL